MIWRRKALRPFSGGGRRTVAAIFITFALVAGLSIALSLSATGRSKNRATVVEVAGRQRTLAERYVKEVLLVLAGRKADPATTASALDASAKALLDGGTAPAMNGDDDDTSVPQNGPSRFHVIGRYFGGSTCLLLGPVVQGVPYACPTNRGDPVTITNTSAQVASAAPADGAASVEPLTQSALDHVIPQAEADWLALQERLRGVLHASAGQDTPYLRILLQWVRE